MEQKRCTSTWLKKIKIRQSLYAYRNLFRRRATTTRDISEISLRIPWSCSYPYDGSHFCVTEICPSKVSLPGFGEEEEPQKVLHAPAGRYGSSQIVAKSARIAMRSSDQRSSQQGNLAIGRGRKQPEVHTMQDILSTLWQKDSKLCC